MPFFYASRTELNPFKSDMQIVGRLVKRIDSIEPFADKLRFKFLRKDLGERFVCIEASDLHRAKDAAELLFDTQDAMVTITPFNRGNDPTAESCSCDGDTIESEECVVCPTCKEWTSRVLCADCKDIIFESSCCS